MVTKPKETKRRPVPLSFIYKGIFKKNKKKTKGEIFAADIRIAESKLKASGIQITKIKKKPKDLIPKRIKYEDITSFFRQLATLTRAGIPIIQSLEILIEGIGSHIRFRMLVEDIKDHLSSGENLSDSIEQYPQYFDDLYFGLIRAGEDSGTLDIILTKITEQREKAESIKRKITKAMSYPIVICIIAAGVTTILLTFAVPAFAKLFNDAGKDLPKLTQITMSASEFMQAYWWVVIVGIIGLITGFKFAKKRFPRIQIYQDLFMLKIPIFGRITELSALERFASLLKITLGAGMNLIDSLKIISISTGNYKFNSAVLEMKNDVEEGNSFSISMKDTAVFPSLLEQVVAVGEETGNMEEMLDNITIIYKEQIDTVIDSLNSLLEPLIMVILGVIVGFLVLSMYLPMFQMGNAIS